jgi:predicted lipoprotein with Yx(FWY)xxD motif
MRQRISHLAGALTIAATALLVAGCGSDDPTGAAPATNGSAAVSVDSVDGHDVLVDAEGRTLYTAAVERDGIRCVDTCVSFWKPVFTAATDPDTASPGLRAELGTVDRPEGTSQLTYDGLPLYTFTQEAAGEVTGDGFTDDFQGTHFEWSAVTPDGSDVPSTGSDSGSSGSGRYGY